MSTGVEIRSGDVLLFHGNGFISWAIRKFDGTDVNHAAIALDATTLGEAAGSGLRRTSIGSAVASNSFMRVRRHTDTDVTPVLGAANAYLDDRHPYAYQQIILLGLLASTRKITFTGPAKRMVRSILDHAAAALNGFLDRDGRRSMICSEFVYRVYREAVATPAERYRILIQIGHEAFDHAEQSVAAWGLGQPDDKFEAVINRAVSFAASDYADPVAADEVAEQQLAPLIAEWAQTSGQVDDDMPPPPPPSFGPSAAEEPTDAEMLSALVAFSAAYADATSEAPPSFGVGSVISLAAARGAIRGLVSPDIESNFVTPGDLLRSPTLADVGMVQAGS